MASHQKSERLPSLCHDILLQLSGGLFKLSTTGDNELRIEPGETVPAVFWFNDRMPSNYCPKQRVDWVEFWEWVQGKKDELGSLYFRCAVAGASLSACPLGFRSTHVKQVDRDSGSVLLKGSLDDMVGVFEKNTNVLCESAFSVWQPTPSQRDAWVPLPELLEQSGATIVKVANAANATATLFMASLTPDTILDAAASKHVQIEMFVDEAGVVVSSNRQARGQRKQELQKLESAAKLFNNEAFWADNGDGIVHCSLFLKDQNACLIGDVTIKDVRQAQQGIAVTTEWNNVSFFGASDPVCVSQSSQAFFYVDTHTVKIYNTCIGCTQCVRACPTDVLEMIPWDGCKSGQIASAPRLEDCVGCKRCEAACPTDFLSVRVYLGAETTRTTGLAY